MFTRVCFRAGGIEPLDQSPGFGQPMLRFRHATAAAVEDLVLQADHHDRRMVPVVLQNRPEMLVVVLPELVSRQGVPDAEPA